MSKTRIGMAVVVIVALAGPASSQTSRSAADAGRLTELLQQRKMRHVAARNSTDPSRYVAAMLIGDGQLFVVSARYSQPALLNERLFRGDYEGAYQQLNSASLRDGKLFVQDLGAPGLHPTRASDQAFDIVYESGTKRTVFDGDWKAQKLSKAEYHAAFDRLDARYAQALDTLLEVLESEGAATPTNPSALQPHPIAEMSESDEQNRLPHVGPRRTSRPLPPTPDR